MRRAALFLLCACLLSACAPKAADHEQISPERRLVALFSHVTAENSPKHLAAARFAETAKQLTGGRVEVQVYPNSQLYKDVEEIAALRDGEIQFIAVSPSKLTAFDPQWEIFDLPYLFTDFADVDRLFASTAVAKMRARLIDQGLIPLGIWPGAFKQLTNERRPLVRPADFAGLTFRVQPGEVLKDQFAAVGAKAVVSTFDTVYAEIEQGAVDGQENTLSNIYTLNLQALQPYLTISDHGYMPYVVLTQAAWWNGLDPQIRTALQQALTGTTSWMRDNAPKLNDQALGKIMSTGNVQVRVLSPDERAALKAAFAPAYDAMARREGAAFVEQVVQAARGGNQ